MITRLQSLWPVPEFSFQLFSISVFQRFPLQFLLSAFPISAFPYDAHRTSSNLRSDPFRGGCGVLLRHIGLCGAGTMCDSWPPVKLSESGTKSKSARFPAGSGCQLDLATGKARHTDYGGNMNPPILHRKETFLPAGHPLRAQFEALTRAEEAAGLYKSTETIGFKLNWEKILSSKGLEIHRHSLRQRAALPGPSTAPSAGAAGRKCCVAEHGPANDRYSAGGRLWRRIFGMDHSP